jgi:hypothetical protein
MFILANFWIFADLYRNLAYYRRTQLAKLKFFLTYNPSPSKGHLTRLTYTAWGDASFIIFDLGGQWREKVGNPCLRLSPHSKVLSQNFPQSFNILTIIRRIGMIREDKETPKNKTSFVSSAKLHKGCQLSFSPSQNEGNEWLCTFWAMSMSRCYKVISFEVSKINLMSLLYSWPDLRLQGFLLKSCLKKHFHHHH